MNDAFVSFLDQACRAIAKAEPELFIQMGLYAIGDEPIRHREFTAISVTAAQERVDMMNDLALRLDQISLADLDPSEQITARTLHFFFRYAHDRRLLGAEGRAFLRHEHLLRPSGGVQSDPVLFLTELHPLRNEEDARNYIQMAESLTPLFDEASRETIARIELGITPPRVVIEAALQEAQEFLSASPQENMIYTAFAEKVSHITALSEADREALRAELAAVLKRTVYPSYSRLIADMERIIPDCSDEIGLWALPDGDSYYEFLLRCATTTELTAAEIHELGQSEIERLEAEILSLAQGFTSGARNISECFAALDNRGVKALEDNEINRRQVLEQVRALVSTTQSRLQPLFHALPKGRASVRAMPRFAEKSRPHTYQPPSLDGTRSGFYELNTAQALGEADATLKLTAYHELYPGHHLQIACAQENASLPLLRRILTFDAYIEGWAKYAELLPALHGLDDDIVYQLTRLRHELISTANLVLDTGIHAKRWSAEEAADFCQKHTGKTRAFADYIVRRSISAPAQLCSYKIGLMSMVEIRRKMETALGADFNVRDFHELALGQGAVPLTVLGEIADRRIAELTNAKR